MFFKKIWPKRFQSHLFEEGRPLSQILHSVKGHRVQISWSLPNSTPWVVWQHLHQNTSGSCSDEARAGFLQVISHSHPLCLLVMITHKEQQRLPPRPGVLTQVKSSTFSSQGWAISWHQWESWEQNNVVFYCTAFLWPEQGLIPGMLSPVNPLLRQMSQSRLCPSDPLPSPEAPKLSCLPIPLTPDALLYSKKKMPILQLFDLINLSLHQVFKREFYLFIFLIASHMCSAARAMLSRCLPAICSSSVPHGASDWIFKRNKGFESNSCAIVFHA